VNDFSISENAQLRFGGIIRLYGTRAFLKLQQSHALIVGIGGVGSWTAEALCRSGFGAISLIDMDDICITNSNRQVHTLDENIGQLKTKTMATRLQSINPEIEVNSKEDFLDKNNLSKYINQNYSIIIDAIDNAIDKTELIAFCTKNNIPIITVGSSGGKKDPSRITFGDLQKTTGDPLFAKIRNNLRRYHGFSRNTKKNFGVEAIYSEESMVFPDDQGEICTTKSFLEGHEKLDCSGGYGAATMVTASFGFLAASRAIEMLIKKRND
jgi:tRNA A37 threonylcarbamoyladenosine dehydratase